MTKKYIESYSFFKFLAELSSLPDKMYSNTYFFKRSTKIDFFTSCTCRLTLESYLKRFGFLETLKN